MKSWTGFVVVIAALGLLTVSLSAQTGMTDLHGKWIVFIPGHDMSIVLDLKQDGVALTGNLAITGHPNMSLQGELVEGKLRMKTSEDAFMQIAFSGTVQDNGTLAGNLTSEMGEMTWTAERAQ